jgi:hypothetical protein
MFQVFNLNVAKVDLGCCIRCKCKIRMLQAYVWSVSYVCLIFHLDVSKVDLHVAYVAIATRACFKCFICFRLTPSVPRYKAWFDLVWSSRSYFNHQFILLYVIYGNNKCIIIKYFVKTNLMLTLLLVKHNKVWILKYVHALYPEKEGVWCKCFIWIF